MKFPGKDVERASRVEILAMYGIIGLALNISSAYPASVGERSYPLTPSANEQENNSEDKSCSVLRTATETLRELPVAFSQLPITLEDLDAAEALCSDQQSTAASFENTSVASAIIETATYISAQCDLLRLFTNEPRGDFLSRVFNYSSAWINKPEAGETLRGLDTQAFDATYVCEPTPGQGVPSFIQRITLANIRDKVEETRRSGQVPVVIVDLDDTLLSTATRIKQAIYDFIPTCSEFLSVWRSAPDYYQYSNDNDNLSSLTGHGFVQFFAARFFSNDYLQYDIPFPGAVAYVNSLLNAGAEIYYLTGRSLDSAEAGTLASLAKYGFPTSVESEHVHLIMKPGKSRDNDFKKATLEDILGAPNIYPAAIFDDDPVSMAAMSPCLPSETVKVMVSPKYKVDEGPIDIPNGIIFIKDFRLKE